MQGTESGNTNSRRETLNSSKLKWLSVLSYTSITLAVLDRDTERSGGDSIYGAIPNNKFLFYFVATLAGVQSLAYLHLGINTAFKIYQHQPSSGESNQPEGLFDTLYERKFIGILYWGLASLSCISALLNSLYLIVLLPLYTKNNDGSHKFYTENASLPFNNTINSSSIPQANLMSNSSFYQIDMAHQNIENMLSRELYYVNRLAVSISVWTWNLTNLVEIAIFILCRPKRDKCNAFVSSVEFVANVSRTLVINKVAEEFTYPSFVISKWLSLPYYASYKKLLHYFKSDSSAEGVVVDVQPPLV